MLLLPSYHHLKWLVYIVMHVLGHNDVHYVGIPYSSDCH